MDVEEMGGRLAEFTRLQQDGSALTSGQLDGLLAELNSLASEVRGLEAADQQAGTAKVDGLRRQFTDWYNAAVERERSAGEPIGVLSELDNEFHDLRERWIAGDESRAQLQSRMMRVLSQARARPEGEQLALHIQSFLDEDVANAN